jgi:thiol-disulfide isomerase/thioredoxin
MSWLVSLTKFRLLIPVLICANSLSAQSIAKGMVTYHPASQKQTFEEVKELGIGDKVPEIILDRIHNYSKSSAKLSDFKGKVVILDFWATWCGSCVEAFPKMDELQKEFDEDLQIILVNAKQTFDSEEKIAQLFKRQKEFKGYAVKLPYVNEDSLLQQFFPHRYVPHYVWINSAGVVVAFSSNKEVSKNSIQSVINGEIPTFRIKKDILNFDHHKPLFIDNNGEPGQAKMFRSTISPYIEGLGFTSGKVNDENGNITRMYYLNTPLYSLYRSAFDLLTWSSNRIVIETSNSALLNKNSEINWDYDGAYCYELMTPGNTEQEMLKYMKQDLERYFRITVKLETRQVPVYIVKPLKSNNGSTNLQGSNSSLKIPLSTVIRRMNDLFDKPVYYDGDNTGKLIFVPSNFYDLRMADLKKLLVESGFTCSVGSKQIEMAVFKNL